MLIWHALSNILFHLSVCSHLLLGFYLTVRKDLGFLQYDHLDTLHLLLSLFVNLWVLFSQLKHPQWSWFFLRHCCKLAEYWLVEYYASRGVDIRTYSQSIISQYFLLHCCFWNFLRRLNNSRAQLFWYLYNLTLFYVVSLSISSHSI